MRRLIPSWSAERYTELEELPTVLVPLQRTTTLMPEHFSTPLDHMRYPVKLDFSHERFQLRSVHLLSRLKDTALQEIDLSDKGQMFQFKLAKNKVQTKEMPVTILVPNPRTVYCQQLSFASVAKTIMTMCFVGQNLNLQMSKKLSPQEIDYLQFYLKNLRYLQELDVKV